MSDNEDNEGQGVVTLMLISAGIVSFIIALSIMALAHGIGS